MSRVKVGFFSLSESLGEEADRSYLAWHQLDHMPEQYQLAGMLLGQRWMSTPRCRAARAADVGAGAGAGADTGAGDWDAVEHVVLYLMGEPVESTLDDFMRLGESLRRAGRYPVALPSVYAGTAALAGAAAAPSALVLAEVVPWRPNRGVYLMVEEARDGAGRDAVLQVPGVAGMWRFQTEDRYRRWQRTPGAFRFTVVYLDGDPAVVGPAVGDALIDERPGGTDGVLLAAPFEAVVPWAWKALSGAGTG